MSTPRWEPDVFDSLAALNQLRLTRKRSPEFYARYRQPLDLAEGFTGFLGFRIREVGVILRVDGAPMHVVAQALRRFFLCQPHLDLDVGWFDQQMTIVMQQLLPLFDDPALPGWMEDCRAWIEEAFC